MDFSEKYENYLKTVSFRVERGPTAELQATVRPADEFKPPAPWEYETWQTWSKRVGRVFFSARILNTSEDLLDSLEGPVDVVTRVVNARPEIYSSGSGLYLLKHDNGARSWGILGKRCTEEKFNLAIKIAPLRPQGMLKSYVTNDDIDLDKQVPVNTQGLLRQHSTENNLKVCGVEIVRDARSKYWTVPKFYDPRGVEVPSPIWFFEGTVPSNWKDITYSYDWFYIPNAVSKYRAATSAAAATDV